MKTEKGKSKKGKIMKFRCTECGITVENICGEPKVCENCHSRWSYEEVTDED